MSVLFHRKQMPARVLGRITLTVALNISLCGVEYESKYESDHESKHAREHGREHKNGEESEHGSEQGIGQGMVRAADEGGK